MDYRLPLQALLLAAVLEQTTGLTELDLRRNGLSPSTAPVVAVALKANAGLAVLSALPVGAVRRNQITHLDLDRHDLEDFELAVRTPWPPPDGLLEKGGDRSEN